MAKALWNGVVLAESDDIVVVEGNAYFPKASLNEQYFAETREHTACAWKGTASYLDVVVDDQRNVMAAWTYPNPSPAAENIRDRVAFWGGITVEE